MSKAGRISELDKNPELRGSVAALWVSGMTQTAMAEELGFEIQTIRRWLKDDGVLKIATRLTKERTIRITRKTEAALERKLLKADNVDIETLLKIQKQYLPKDISEPGADQTQLLTELWLLADKNPALAEALQELGAVSER